MLAERDVDHTVLLIEKAFQGGKVLGIPPAANDASTREGNVILQVWDPVNKFMEFKEFENFVDFNTVDPEEYGCLSNGGEAQKALLKKYEVGDSMRHFTDACNAAKTYDSFVGRSVHPTI